MHFFVLKICTYQKKAVPLQRKTKTNTAMTNYEKICKCTREQRWALPCKYQSAWWCNQHHKDIRDIDNCTKWNNNN